MILAVVLGAALVHLVSFGIFIWLGARAPEGDEEECEREGVPNDNVVSILELRGSKLARQSIPKRFMRAGASRG